MVEGLPDYSGGEIDAFSSVRPVQLGDSLTLTPDKPTDGTAALHFQRPDPKNLPPEPLTTYVVRTDGEGHFFVAFPDPGWWVVGAYVNNLGKVRREETDFLLEGFAGLWVRVEEATQMREP